MRGGAQAVQQKAAKEQELEDSLIVSKHVLCATLTEFASE